MTNETPEPKCSKGKHGHIGRVRHWSGLAIGLGSLLWFVVRVVPKPSRAAYPCQRAALVSSSAFVAWLLGIAGSAVAFRKSLAWWARARWTAALLAIATAALVVSTMLFGMPARLLLAWTPTDPPNQPIGVARGIHPGRVVWVHDAAAAQWDGQTGHWWDPTATDQSAVDSMLEKSLSWLTGQPTSPGAWDALFRDFNARHGRGQHGYRTGETIVIKINQNTARTDHSLNGNTNDENSINGNPHLVLALLHQLIDQAGVPGANITVYDASRWIGDNIFTPAHAALPSVHFMDGHGGDGRDQVQWTATDVISYAVTNPNSAGRKIPVQVQQAAYVINMAIMKNHGDGPTLNAKNHYGSINGQDHNWFNANMGSYSVLVDLMGYKDLGEKTVLFMIDALYGAPTPDAAPSKWHSAPFNDAWPSSVFVFEDNVAIDSVGFDFMNAEWGLANNSDNHLHEAALANDPPSKIKYAPNGDGVMLTSLGVHEHWNNATDKQYSRNLDPAHGTGIELVTTAPAMNAGGAGGSSAMGTGGTGGRSSSTGGSGTANAGAAGAGTSSKGDSGCSCALSSSGQHGASAAGILFGLLALGRRKR